MRGFLVVSGKPACASAVYACLQTLRLHQESGSSLNPFTCCSNADRSVCAYRLWRGEGGQSPGQEFPRCCDQAV